MAKPFEAKVKTRWNLRRPKAVAADVADALLPPFIEIAQDIVADAVKGSPFLTGHNRRSIGWAASGWGNRNFGSIEAAAGNVPSSDYKQSSPDRVSAKAATTSGYGGFLELGTRKMPARPYLLPAALKQRSNIQKVLKGIL